MDRLDAWLDGYVWWTCGALDGTAFQRASRSRAAATHAGRDRPTVHPRVHSAGRFRLSVQPVGTPLAPTLVPGHTAEQA